jgi:hypothetical protein
MSSISKLDIEECYSFIIEEIKNKKESNYSHHALEDFAIKPDQQTDYFQDQEKAITAEKLKNLVTCALKQHPLNNPFPISQPNENAALADKKTLEWIKRFKLIQDEKSLQKFLASNFIKLTAAAYPHCSLERFSAIVDCITFLYINDDMAENRDSKSLQAYNIRCMMILKNESQMAEDDEPLTLAANDLIRRIDKFAQEYWFQRFLHNLDRHFQSTVWEAENRELGIAIPDFRIYMQMRLQTSGVEVVEPLIEFAHEINIPENIFEKHLKEMSRMFNLIIFKSNDIVSSPKELKQNSQNNLIFIIKQEFGCSIEDAIKYVIALHNKAVDNFEDLKNKLYAKLDGDEPDPELKPYRDDIRKYVEGIRDWMASHYAFYTFANSARYSE